MQRNRSEFLFFLISVLLVGLIMGHGLSGYVAAQTGSTYKDLEIFSDALSIVQNEYVEEVTTETLIYGALRGMLNKLDAHSQFMPPNVYRDLKVETEGHFGGLGIVIQLDDNKILTVVAPIEDTPAFRAGIRAGDKIIKIEDESTHGMILEEAVKKLRGPKGSEVTITISRLNDKNGIEPETLEITLERADIKIPSVKKSELLENDIGYIRLVEFSERTGSDLKKKLAELKEENVRSLVLDLRHNPGGLLNVAAEVADIFLEKGQLIVYTESRNSDQNMEFKAKDNPLIDPDVPLVVLVDGASASASEIVAGALRDSRRAVILGEKTFGKGSVQSIIPLSDGSALRLTTAKYLTPDGHSINGVGIVPDIEVKITKKEVIGIFGGYMPGEPDKGEEKDKVVDVQLQRAIELLQGYDIFKTLEQNVNIAMEKTGPESEGDSKEEDVEQETETEAPPADPVIPNKDSNSIPEIMTPDSEESPSDE